jgi:hypothetical protein
MRSLLFEKRLAEKRVFVVLAAREGQLAEFLVELHI